MNPIAINDLLVTFAANAVKVARHDDAAISALNAQIEVMKQELEVAQKSAKIADAEVTRLKELLAAADAKIAELEAPTAELASTAG